jgi:hypothetical protein
LSTRFRPFQLHWVHDMTFLCIQNGAVGFSRPSGMMT